MAAKKTKAQIERERKIMAKIFSTSRGQGNSSGKLMDSIPVHGTTMVRTGPLSQKMEFDKPYKIDIAGNPDLNKDSLRNRKAKLVERNTRGVKKKIIKKKK
jgi:hypothetical protein